MKHDTLIAFPILKISKVVEILMENTVCTHRSISKQHAELHSLLPNATTLFLKPLSESLVQIMACRLEGAKSLPAPMLEYCWLEF